MKTSLSRSYQYTISGVRTSPSRSRLLHRTISVCSIFQQHRTHASRTFGSSPVGGRRTCVQTLSRGGGSQAVGSSQNSFPDKQSLEAAEADELQAAIKAANKAVEEAEASVSEVEHLPSSRLPQKVPVILKALLYVLGGLGVSAGLSLSHLFGWPFRISVGILAGVALGLYGFRRGSLSRSGSILASVVGAATLAASVRSAFVLLTFFFTSSKLTTYCEDRKLHDEDFKEGGQRDWKQVFCNGAVPTALAVSAAVASGGFDLPLLGYPASRLYAALAAAFLGYFACCCGDTWASEVGQLSEEQPRLVTSFRPVRKGTNGGVTKLGLLASAGGGLCMGVAFYAGGILSPRVLRESALRDIAVRQTRLIPFGLLAGVFGSLVDSVLGATIQFTGYNRRSGKITSRMGDDVTKISGVALLDNNAVNFVSASIVAVAAATLITVL